LRDGGEQKLIIRTARPPEAQSIQLQDSLEVREEPAKSRSPIGRLRSAGPNQSVRQ